MIKLLVYTDGRPEAPRALHFAAELKRRLEAELSVMTVRPGTHAAEEPPPVGTTLTIDQHTSLPPGLQILLHAASVLVDKAVLTPIDSIKIRDVPQGYMFFCNGAADERIAFYECFGHFVEAINKEVDEHGYHLLIAAPPRRSRFGRLVAGNTTRMLALDLHTSLLVVRGGGPDGRFLVCADGSPSARRQFPMLQQLLPAIQQPVDLLCVHPPDADPQIVAEADACLQQAGQWLAGCQKLGVVDVRESRNRTDTILEAAGETSIIMMGSSLRHDVYRRMMGTLPMQILERTSSSVMLVKRLPEGDPDFMKIPFTCG
jgi:nucleotide-binding universal stress UspA family protein